MGENRTSGPDHRYAPGTYNLVEAEETKKARRLGVTREDISEQIQDVRKKRRKKAY